MKIFKQTNFKKTNNKTIPKIGEILCLYDWTQAHWLKVLAEQNWLFKWEFITFGINGSNIQKGDLVFFEKEYIKQTLYDLQHNQESMNTTYNKRGWKWRASFWWKN